MAAEMAYYKVPDPYGRPVYYRNHYICLWEVTEEEVVGTWAWEDLCEHADWYDNVILLAYRNHNQKARDAIQDSEKLYLSELGEALPALDEDSGGKYPIDDDWNSSSENESCNLGYGSDWDTDDEVEEANMTDDMFKILEGDWS